jgi:acyl-CoA thioesterase II
MFAYTLVVPIIYQVQRIRDGKSFATRKVDAIQKGNIVFTLMASFQVMLLPCFVFNLYSDKSLQ